MRKHLVSLFWWIVTILTLFILDDLVFGPFFWAVSVWSQPLATGLAFAASWSFGMWLIIASLRANPSRPSQFMLNRLMLARQNGEIARREASIRHQAASVAGAFLVTPLIGAVIPTLLLAKHNVLSSERLVRLAVPMTALYASEFALIHGGYGIGGIFSYFF
jgi:hypothetical protein